MTTLEELIQPYRNDVTNNQETYLFTLSQIERLIYTVTGVPVAWFIEGPDEFTNNVCRAMEAEDAGLTIVPLYKVETE